MIYYLNNSTSSNLTITDLKLVGEKNLLEMGSKPFYTPRYRGKILQKRNEKVCAETGGDCLEFVQKFLDVYWI
tara:strand:- start:505 stop:723 length:219 start_codon:yes stop_codon:yes gene_type:complete